MDIFKFGEIYEQMGSGDVTECSCGKKKKRKKIVFNKWKSDIMSEKCKPCMKINKKRKKKIVAEPEMVIEKCNVCGGFKKKKLINKEKKINKIKFLD